MENIEDMWSIGSLAKPIPPVSPVSPLWNKAILLDILPRIGYLKIMGFRLTVANLLTLIRLIIVPFFIAAFVMGHVGFALLLFCVAGVTDLIDGTVARLLGQHSVDGALLDPLADKCLVQSCFIVLGITGVLPWWFVILALTRDVLIVGGIIYFKREGVLLPYGAATISKFATFMQLAVAVLGIISTWKPHAEAAQVSVWQWLEWTIYVAAALIIFSGIKYVSMGIAILRQHKASRA